MSKGFTLIELLIVIGILAILATTVVLVLNPAQILQETRDTQRISDLSSVSSAIGLYLATASGTLSLGTCTGTQWRAESAHAAAAQPFTNPTTVAAATVSATPRATDSSGWVSVDFGAISGGSPLSVLPIDPSPAVGSPTDTYINGARFYSYTCSGTNYEINANMESTKFNSNAACTGTTADPVGVECTDGGASARNGVTTDVATANQVYEIGTDPSLDL